MAGGDEQGQRFLSVLDRQVQLRGQPASGAAEAVVVRLGVDAAGKLFRRSSPLFYALQQHAGQLGESPHNPVVRVDASQLPGDARRTGHPPAHIGADPGSVNKAYFATEAFDSAETAAAGYKRWSDGIAREGKDSLVSPGSAGAIGDQSVFYSGQEPTESGTTYHQIGRAHV